MTHLKSNVQSNLKLWWLVVFITLVLIMIGLGGATRLTRSGLSIVEWKPISGIIPPITNDDWQNQFALYQQTPEYQQINHHFNIDDYKNIFIAEYLHRVLGRLIFLFALIPGLFLWRKKLVSLKLVLGLTMLIATQGLLGWLMVKSGLNTNPHVSPFMLAAHFFLALVVLVTAYFHLSKMRKPLIATVTKTQKWLWAGLGLSICLQVFFGCLTSGLSAGFIFNTYPLMGGHFFPVGQSFFSSSLIAVLENPVLVQWTHRWLGLLLFFMITATAISILKSKTNQTLRGPFRHFVSITAVQVILGILNIIFVVPTPLAVIHQVIAALVVLAYFNILFRFKDASLLIPA